MCHHLDAREWEALREEVHDPESTEPIDEDERPDDPTISAREPLAPSADD